MPASSNVIWTAPTDEIATRQQAIHNARAERQTLEPLRTAIIPLSYANGSEMADLIQTATGESGGDGSDDRGTAGLLYARGSVTGDQRTNTLLVHDNAERLECE